MGDVSADLNADAVIDRMRKALMLRTDITLGAYFGHGTSTVSGWRQRNRVPYAECVILAIRKGLSLDWLLLGVGSPTPDVGSAVTEPASSYGDPRVARLVRFLHAWQASHDDDDMAWLERSIARAIPEYGEWLAGQPKARD